MGVVPGTRAFRVLATHGRILDRDFPGVSDPG